MIIFIEKLINCKFNACNFTKNWTKTFDYTYACAANKKYMQMAQI